MHKLLAVTRREIDAAFASPVAYIFMGVFAGVSLFLFFWVEKFFARNIADVRILFEWMPLLLLFLVAAITMRSWSEERRSGTIELLLTSPTASVALIGGKFLAALFLLLASLLLTLPLPSIVSTIGYLDWGPVWGGYLAALLLGAAYISVGLYVSLRTDNQVVSLIVTIVICGLLYLIGSPLIADFFSQDTAEILRQLGSGARFDSIGRGVIDLRDVLYYFSISIVFLTLGLVQLERLRWAPGNSRSGHVKWYALTVMVIIAALLLNLGMARFNGARADLTAGKIYTISDATLKYLDDLEQPLVIRGYFSARTHPLLSPLVPQLRDLLKEYENASGGDIELQIVDPLESAEIEQEAGEKYGITPVAFQTSDKYQASLVNSYFDILIESGGEYETLGYRDLIDIKMASETDLEVQLRNPEYDITRAIRRVIASGRGRSAISDPAGKPVVFRGFISSDETLPVALKQFREVLREELDLLQQELGDRISVEIRDPQAGDGELAQTILEKYGFRPQVLGLIRPDPFFFYMLLEIDGQTTPVSLPDQLQRDGLKEKINEAFYRLTPGVLHTVGLLLPPEPQLIPGLRREGQATFMELEKHLLGNYRVKKYDLNDGLPPDSADVLLVVDPENLTEFQQFAIDQYLMKGGTVIAALSPWHVEIGGGAIAAREQKTGLEAWLEHNGVTMDKALVMDARNTPFPIPVQRKVGDLVVDEVQSFPYPFFPDIRSEGLEQEHGIVSGLNQLTLNWAAPLIIDGEQRTVRKLFWSSPESWTIPTPSIQPDFEAWPGSGFPQGGITDSYLLGAILEGPFTSLYSGKESPLLEELSVASGDGQRRMTGVIEKSSNKPKLIVISSGSFLADTVIDLATQATGSHYRNTLEMIDNLIDWSLEDHNLLALRGRGFFARTLYPLKADQQKQLEMTAYFSSFAGLVLFFVAYRIIKGLRDRRRNQLIKT